MQMSEVPQPTALDLMAYARHHAEQAARFMASDSPWGSVHFHLQRAISLFEQAGNAFEAEDND